MILRTKILKAKARGFTLTELAIVLAVLGIVLAAVWGAADHVIRINKSRAAVNGILTIADNVRQTYMGANQFSGAGGDMTATMVAANVIPSDLLAPVGSPTPTINAWGGRVIVWEKVGGDPRNFRVSFYATPPDACFRIASQLVNLGTTDAPYNFITNAGGQVVAIPPSNAGVNAVTMGQIDAMCQANQNVANASTEFDFRIH